MSDLDQDGTIFVGKGDQAGGADAGARQPPRAGDRRDRHRQDRDVAGAGGRLVARRRVGVRGRHQGRPVRHRRRSARPRRLSSSAPRDMGFDYEPDEFPVVFWDVFGEQGHPVRATISEMGPLLLSRLMDLNDVQEGVLNIAFRVADEQGLLLLDLKDLRAMLGLHRRPCRRADRRNTATSRRRPIGTIQRQLLVLENQGGDKFFGEPALDAEGLHPHRPRRPRHHQHPRRRQADGEPAALRDLPAVAAVRAVRANCPRSAIRDKPKLVLLLRRGASAVQRRAEGAARQDRAGGAADPLEGRRRLFRHAESARRARQGSGASSATACSTRCARSRRATRRRCEAAAETFRANPKLDTAKVIMELGKGEALVSFLEGNGTPSMVERCMIRPPSARHRPDHAGGAQGADRPTAR